MVNTKPQLVLNFLEATLKATLSVERFIEYSAVIKAIQTGKSPSFLYTSFSKVVRLFGKAPVHYTPAQLKEAGSAMPGWTPPSSVDKIIRSMILLSIPQTDSDNYFNTIEELFSAGDVGELSALYTALPVLPFPEKFISRCMEGVRTNMGEVFEAVANNNVYPSLYLDEDAFNQLVLKCLFVGKPLYKITNLEKRLNAKLAIMASDFAQERWAAHRDVSPELWKIVEPFLGHEKLNSTDKFTPDWKNLKFQVSSFKSKI